MCDDYINELRMNSEEAEQFFAHILAFTMNPGKVHKKIEEKEEGIVIVDVRKHEVYKYGHIPGAISIPKEELENRLNELSRNNIHIVYTYDPYCSLAVKACLFLARNGFPAVKMKGGYDAWANYYKYEIEKSEA